MFTRAVLATPVLVRLPSASATMLIPAQELGVIMRLPGSDVEAAGHQLVTWQHPLRPFEASDEPWMQRSWEKSGKASEDDDEAN